MRAAEARVVAKVVEAKVAVEREVQTAAAMAAVAAGSSDRNESTARKKAAH